MTEKQRKAFVELIKNPKNSKMTLGEAWNPRWGEPNIPSTRNDRSGRGNKCLEIDLSKIEDQLKGKLSEEHLDKLFSLEQDGKRIELQAEWSWYDEPSVNASGEDPEGSVEIVDEDNWRSYLMQEGFSEEEIDTLFETILDYYENAEDEDWEWETAYYDQKRERERECRKEKAYQDLKNLKEHKHSNRMGKFDYKEYLAHNWLLQEAQAPLVTAEDWLPWLTEPVSRFAHYCKRLEGKKEGGCRGMVLSVLQAYGIPKSILEDATERVVEEILEPEEGDIYSPYESDETVSEWLEGLFDDDSWQEGSDEQEGSAVEQLTQLLNDVIVDSPYVWFKSRSCPQLPVGKFPYGSIAVDDGAGNTFFLGNESEDSDSPLLVNRGFGKWEKPDEEDARNMLEFADNSKEGIVDNIVFFDPGMEEQKN